MFTIWGARNKYCDGISRRSFLRIGAFGAGLTLADLLRAKSRAAERGEPTRQKSAIMVYLGGGPSHLDMWDLKPNAPAEIRGPFRPIATRLPGVQVCEHLPRLAGLTDRYALVRSVSHNNHNHTPMIYYTLTGRPVERPEADNDVRPPQRTDFPHLGAVLARFRPAPRGVPGYVAIPEVAVRSSTRGEYRRAWTLLRGGGLSPSGHEPSQPYGAHRRASDAHRLRRLAGDRRPVPARAAARDGVGEARGHPVRRRVQFTAPAAPVRSRTRARTGAALDPDPP